MSMQFKILLSRFLTRFGDQAWDFAVPLVLIQIFPGKIQLIAVIYLFSKLTQIFAGPAIARKIDNEKRATIYKLGIGSQTIAMCVMWFLILLLLFNSFEGFSLSAVSYFILLGALALFSAVANLGSSLMDISVGFDLAVEVLPKEELSLFNSRLKRLDLFTEVTAPVFTGAVLSLFSNFPLWGFSIIALLNLFTFLPEYLLLRSTRKLKLDKEIKTMPEKNNNFIAHFVESMKNLHHKPYALVIISYAFLWLSVLSPHGVLLTSYLKDGAKVSEFSIGLFRGLGAFFGLIPTFLYTPLTKKYGVVYTSKLFLASQFFFVVIAAVTFFTSGNITYFLGAILFSRIGLYGFSIGETELRQVMIPRDSRGEVNGIANSITSMATLLLFLFGTVIGDTSNFGMMIFLSLTAVFVALVLFLRMDKVIIRNNDNQL